MTIFQKVLTKKNQHSKRLQDLVEVGSMYFKGLETRNGGIPKSL